MWTRDFAKAVFQTLTAIQIEDGTAEGDPILLVHFTITRIGTPSQAWPKSGWNKRNTT